MAKPKKKSKVNKKIDNKADLPVLNSPAESRAGRIVIWIILIAMVLGSLAGLIAIIIQSVK
ncbi:MAG: hypothetical protein ACOX56_03630 [Acholeplasmataceae bacterium]